jgi:general secretion pathway protein B
MSLILEALKKAEQERNAGQAPAMQEVLTRPQPMPRPRSNHQQQPLWIAGGIGALAVIGALAYVLWSRPSATPAQTVAAPAAATIPTPAAIASAPAPALRVDPERLQAPINSSDEEAPLQASEGNEAATVDDLVDDTPPTSARKLAESKPAQAAAAPMVGNPASARAKPSASTPVRRPEPESETAAANAQAYAAAMASRSAASSTAAPVAAQAEAIHPLQDMPVSFRSELPKLTVDVHVYDNNPLRRFAIINGKKYREGDTLVEGPHVSEIAEGGVVIEHHGSKVLLELPH